MRSPLALIAFLSAWILFPHLTLASDSQSPASARKTRLAIVGLDHDHVWELLKYIASEPEAELVAIADPHPNLVNQARSQVPGSVNFYSDYIKMLDEAKPEAVFVTTENDRHLEILRECAKRHIHYSTEKPMATNAADAREMERLANQAGIKLMVNYWNAWTASSHDLFHRVKSGEIGPVQKIIVQYGHQGPKEIGVSKEFADWLYDPVKNGGGAIMDFGCYGAEWAIWLKGRPTRVYAATRKLKAEQRNNVDDDATIILDYPDATVIIEASWDWPYSMDRVYVFGPKGSLLARRGDLFLRPASDQRPQPSPEGEPVTLNPVSRETSNPIAYLLDCIRNNKPVEDPLSSKLNVQAMEILDAARESARTGRAVELH
ncbi:MAG TPA: Gfo/Idh/MocA family oxidoreductase [Terriglobales bacterium]|nr:Gfo/Idh/MocA family oxidoreductase [Terriglobales bacterium]